jgi:uncharacterized protein
MNRWKSVVASTFIVLTYIAVAGCGTAPIDKSKPQVRIASRYNRWLDVYMSKLPDIEFSRRSPGGAVDNMDNVQKGEAEIGFAMSDVAYIAFTEGTETDPHPHSKLRGMALLQTTTLHVIVASSFHSRTVVNLRGKRIGVAGSGTKFTTRAILPELGVPLSSVHIEQAAPSELLHGLLDGKFDAAVIMESEPSEFTRDALATGQLRLFPLGDTDTPRLRENYPFFRPIIIPAGTYGDHGDVQTLGVKSVMVCRDDLSDEVVYRMLAVFFDSLPEFVQIQPYFELINLRAVSATPIPLHPGAARFYRERELLK